MKQALTKDRIAPPRNWAYSHLMTCGYCGERPAVAMLPSRDGKRLIAECQHCLELPEPTEQEESDADHDILLARAIVNRALFDALAVS